MSTVKKMNKDLGLIMKKIEEIDEKYSRLMLEKYNISLKEICKSYLNKDTNVLFNLCFNAYEMKVYDFNDSPALQLFCEAMDEMDSILENDVWELVSELNESK